MPTYAYTTKAASGPQYLVADNLPAAISALTSRRIEFTDIGEPPPDAAGDAHLSEGDLCIFLRQLAAMLDNGTPMVTALEMLADESRRPSVRGAVRAVAADVAEGIPLSAALSARPRAFGPLIAALVRAGESGGALVQTLREVADQREGFARIVRQSLGLLVYPATVSFWGFILVTFLLTFIVPKWIALYKELGVRELPFVTLLLMSASHGFLWFLLALLITAGLAFGLCRAYRRSARGRLILDYWRLSTPLLGRINLSLGLARVSSALGLLLQHGVQVLPALRLAGGAAGNAVLGAAFRRAERAVADGRPLADGLRETKVLPESFVWRVAAGEKSGSVAEALSRLGASYAETSQAIARAAQGVMEPVLVILMGLLVLVVVLGIFLPLVGIVSSLSGS